MRKPLQLRLPDDLKDWLKAEADRNGSSQNSEVIRALRAAQTAPVGNAPMNEMPEIHRLADDANAAMEELALFVSERNASGAPWDAQAMARLKELQDAYAAAAQAVQAHPDANLIEVTDGPVVGARKAAS